MVPLTHLPSVDLAPVGMRSRGCAWAVGLAGSPSGHGAVPISRQPLGIWGTFMESGQPSV